jgi:hypothetical protein
LALVHGMREVVTPASGKFREVLRFSANGLVPIHDGK